MVNDDFQFYCRKSLIEDVDSVANWSQCSVFMQPIKTEIYFYEIEETTYFYYGEAAELPNGTIRGYYIDSWGEYINGEITTNILSEVIWDRTDARVEYKPNLIELDKYTILFRNGDVNSDESIIGNSVEIYVGESYSFLKDGYTINGVFTPFSTSQMDYCYYDGQALYNIDSEYCVFDGWYYNGINYSSGIWENIGTQATISLVAHWEPTEYTCTLYDNHGRFYEQITYTYFSEIELEELSETYYVFQYWEDQNGTRVDVLGGRIGDFSLYAYSRRLYVVTYISNEHKVTSFATAGFLGDQITLPTYAYGHYEVKSWGGYAVGTLFTIRGDEYLTATWGGRLYPIIYCNLNFGSVKAEVYWDNTYTLAPTTYEYGVGLDLTRASAFFQSDSPYSPQMRFLGWYTGTGFTTPVPSISATAYAEVYVYAKWRYDYDNPSRSGTYTITDSGRFNQSYDQCYIPLSSYNNLVGMGMKYLAITLKINMWEVNDGYQHIFLYDGSGSDANLLWSCDIEHGSTSAGVHTFQIYVPISQLQNVQYLYIRYGASGNFNDTWKNDKIYYEMMYVADKDDIDSPEFYWSYQDPFD